MTKGDATDHPLIVVEHGYRHDFSDFESLGEIAALAVWGFTTTLSNHERQKNAKAVNQTRAHHFRVWLKYAKKQAEAGYRVDYDLPTYNGYLTFIAKRYRPTTQLASTITIRRLFRDIILRTKRPRVAFPRPMPKLLAIATSEGGRTLADYSRQSDDVKDHKDINRGILDALSSLCWDRIFRLRDRVAQRDKWLAELHNESGELLPGEDAFLTTEEVLSAAVKYVYRDCDGEIPPFFVYTTPGIKRATIDRRRNLERFLQIHSKFADANLPTTIEDVEDCALPMARQLCCFYPLFAREGLNPHSIYDLEIDMLVDVDVGGRTFKRIHSDKYRAGRQLASSAFHVGGTNARTIPRAWEILLRLTKPARDRAIKDQSLLFLALTERSNRDQKLREIKRVDPTRLINSLKKFVMTSSSPYRAELEPIISKLCPRLIRTTMTNVKYAERGIASAQAFLNHRSPATTEIYLNNAARKAALDDGIEYGQNELVAHLLAPASVVAPDPAVLKREHALSDQQAADLISGRCHLGYGVSLVNEHAFVLDTPENFLRMQGWLKAMTNAEERLTLENPTRWERIWLPQIKLFQDALDDFPRRTQMAASKLAAKPFFFPEPH